MHSISISQDFFVENIGLAVVAGEENLTAILPGNWWYKIPDTLVMEKNINNDQSFVSCLYSKEGINFMNYYGHGHIVVLCIALTIDIFFMSGVLYLY